MSTPLFLLQIVDPHGVVVRLPAGGVLERNLISACTTAITAHLVAIRRDVATTLAAQELGLLKTQAHVLATVARVTADADAQTTQAITDGLVDVFRDLKLETVPLAR